VLASPVAENLKWTRADRADSETCDGSERTPVVSGESIQ
jgi:hypothetical protein